MTTVLEIFNLFNSLKIASDMDDIGLNRISQSLYSQLNRVIAPDVIIDVRRTTTDLRDYVFKRISEFTGNDTYPVFSGSKGEGFRFATSDNDWMYIYKDIKVIPSESYTAMYDSNTTLLVMENEITKPGFTLLRLARKSDKPQITCSTERIHRLYVSSKTWRESHTSVLYDKAFTHGPCTCLFGPYKYDFAYCLQCDIWPDNATDCISTLNQCGWPSHDTIRSIFNDGILFVAIGAKHSLLERTEWRMSFSLAEKKLFYSMNHTQFLCYGLLKIFMKEAIDANLDIKGLLCSYFLKTALFWEIVSSPNDWNPSTLLSKFLNCICRLIQWIIRSYCPNFFVPQNNMFEGKIEGSNRAGILKYMKSLYHEGPRCLIRCPSLMPLIAKAIETPRFEIIHSSLEIKSKIGMNIIVEWWSAMIARPIYRHPQIICLILDSLVLSINTGLKGFLLRMWLRQSLRESMQFSIHGENKLQYRSYLQKRNALKLCKTGFIGVYIHKAILYYSVGRYEEVLKLVHYCKEKMYTTHVINVNNTISRRDYVEAGGEDLPIETVMRKSYMDEIWIHSDQCIPEFFIEMHNRLDYTVGMICIPAYACALFLQFLCHENLGCERDKNETLQEFYRTIVQNTIRDDNHESAWQLLGICQQKHGDNQAACHSYLMTLRQDFGILQRAACIRLGTLLVEYF